MSIRSRIGPLIFSAYRRMVAGAQRQSAPGVAACPHGHGLAAMINWNRAGYRACTSLRPKVIVPDSNGVRSASITAG